MNYIAEFGLVETEGLEEHDTDCPYCGGEGTFLGQLGTVVHLRCRDCGGDFHIEEEE